ncbi:MAG: hypothetical protein QOK05_208 [Chloroflexota bacterium]|nr:hypothetical protein [Chloroflexota bacterium]
MTPGPSKVVLVQELPAEYPRTIPVEAFLQRIARLTTAQWDHVMHRSKGIAPGLTQDEVVRGAVVAMTVRELLSVAHFALLYMPFAEAIPVTSLPEAPAPGDDVWRLFDDGPKC